MPAIPAIGASGAEWSVGKLDGAAKPAGGGGGGFGQMLAKQVSELQSSQNDAAQQSQALADGTATDASAVVMSVERARLEMQLAAQLRTKGLEAINDVMHTSV